MREIAARFGADLISSDGTLNRPALRARVLDDPAALSDLNGIIHPAVHRRRLELLAEARIRGDRIVVSDIPLLFEVDDPAGFDAVVLVDAPEELRRTRLLGQRGLSALDADRMMRAQLPAAPKRARSDYVIDNDTDLVALERAAAIVWRALDARA